jgi:hypothetical protein
MVYRDLSTVSFDKASGDEQPKSCSPSEAEIDERFEYQLTICSTDSWPLVTDGELHPILKCARADTDRTPPRRVLVCVFDQVDQDLLCQERVDVKGRQLEGNVELDASVAEMTVKNLQRRCHELIGATGRPIELERSRFVAGHVQETCNKSTEGVGLDVEILVKLAHLVIRKAN